MATIERKPLPPLKSRTAPLTEADRADIMARANDVIDYYLNERGDGASLQQGRIVRKTSGRARYTAAGGLLSHGEEVRVIPATVFAIVGLVVFVSSIIADLKVCNALRDWLPPQFQDPLNSRYAFHVYAFHPSTPLALQADYLKSSAGFCVSALCFALFGFFFFEQEWARWLPSVLPFVTAISTARSWKTYKRNCDRQR